MTADGCAIIGTVDSHASTAKREKTLVAGRRRTGQRAWGPAFLKALADGHSVTKAARLAGVARSTAYEHRVLDPDFGVAWDTAYDEGGDVLVDEAFRRAVEGTETKIFDKEGREVGSRVVYSDRLLEIMLKARRPGEYRDTVQVNATVTHRDDALRKAAARNPALFEELARELAETGD